MKRIVENSLFVIILGFFGACSFFVFTKLFSYQNTKFIENFQGAFLGAFFAFLFIRIADGLNKIYERHAKNSKALNILEHHLNDCGGVIHDNVYTINKFIEMIALYEQKPSLPLLYSSTLYPIPINRDVVIDLINIDYINDIVSYNLRTRKINQTMHSLDNSYQQIKVAFIEKQANNETYFSIVLNLKDEFLVLKSFLEVLLEETIEVLATSRILQRDKSFFSRVVLLTFKKNHTKNFLNQLDREKDSLKAEIEKVRKKSRERIDRIIKK